MVVKLAETCLIIVICAVEGHFNYFIIKLIKDSGSSFGVLLLFVCFWFWFVCFVLFIYFKFTKKLGSQCSSSQQRGMGRKRMDDTRSPPSVKVSKLRPRKHIIKKWRRFNSANKTALVSPNTGCESIICN